MRRASKKKAVYDHDHYPPLVHKKGWKRGEVLDNDPNQRIHKPFKASDGMRCINELCLPFFSKRGRGCMEAVYGHDHYPRPFHKKRGGL